MPRVATSQLSCLLAITAMVRVSAAGSTAPSTEALIAAMPDGTESVLVCRFDKLAARRPRLKDTANRIFDELSALRDKAPDSFHQSIHRAVAQAGLLVQATGGSDFGGPPGVGVGWYVDRSIYVVAKPLADLQRQLERGGVFPYGSKKRTAEGITVYEGRVSSRHLQDPDGEPRQVPWFITLLDERTLVKTQSMDDLLHMIQSLRDSRESIPAQWRDLASRVDFDSAIVILRRYDPSNKDDPWSPFSPRISKEFRANIDGYAVTVPNTLTLKLKMYCRTEEPEKASRFLSKFTGGIDHVERWDIDKLEEGFLAQIPFDYEEQVYLFLSSYVLFGLYIAP